MNKEQMETYVSRSRILKDILMDTLSINNVNGVEAVCALIQCLVDLIDMNEDQRYERFNGVIESLEIARDMT